MMLCVLEWEIVSTSCESRAMRDERKRPRNEAVAEGGIPASSSDAGQFAVDDGNNDAGQLAIDDGNMSSATV